MHSFLLPLGILSVLAWSYLLLARGSFWSVRDKLVPANVSASPAARVAVVIPARNEADVIRHTITSVLAQSSDQSLHIFLVDDGSGDETADIARKAASQLGKSELLTIIEGKPLPAGWSGKLWSLEEGISQTRDFDPEFLLLTDADIVHARDSIATLVTIAQKYRYDLVSFMVKLQCESFAEKLLIPAFVFFFFKLYPPRWIADRKRSTAGAAGGCILIRPEALDRAGGIAAIRGEIIDDCALARRVKQSSGTVWLGLTPSTYSARPYGSFAEIGSMISRTAFNQLRHSLLLLCGALLGLVLVYVLPAVLLFFGRRAAVLGVIAWSMMTIAYMPIVRFYKLNVIWAATLPVAALFYMGATLLSAINYWAGSGGRWKGRVQDPVTS